MQIKSETWPTKEGKTFDIWSDSVLDIPLRQDGGRYGRY